MKKQLGQNFIFDTNLLAAIASDAQIDGKSVVEIGMGAGTLTEQLAIRAAKVVGFEIDLDLKPVLEQRLARFPNVSARFCDFMKCDMKELEEELGGGYKVVANLPYYITSPVIMMLLESEIPVEAITVMVQKEAAQRLCAKMGTRESGAITAAVNYYGSAKLLFHVSRGSFMPAPNVDSAVIQIRPDSKYRDKIQDKALYFKVIKGAFAQRRKTLANSLSSSMEISKDKIYGLLEQCGLEKNSRCEQLTMENWTDFVNLLKNSI